MRTFLRPLHLLLFGKPLTSQFATILSDKLFVIQETVDVLDPVTSWGHIHLCDSPSHKCLSHFIIVLLWHDWEQKGWNCQRCSDSD